MGSKIGEKRGLDKYHNICYTIGGIIVNEHNQAVLCRPLGVLDKKEIEQHLTSQ